MAILKQEVFQQNSALSQFTKALKLQTQKFLSFCLQEKAGKMFGFFGFFGFFAFRI